MSVFVENQGQGPKGAELAPEISFEMGYIALVRKGYNRFLRMKELRSCSDNKVKLNGSEFIVELINILSCNQPNVLGRDLVAQSAEGKA